MPEPKKPAGKPLLTTETPGATFPGSPKPVAPFDPDATPRDRITQAISGKPARSLVEVLAGDVVAVAKEVPDAKHTVTTSALRDGAAQAVRDSQTPDEQTVYQTCSQLKLLLEAAGEPVREGA
ncbi:hypothetical protein R5W24_004449 [Gemmata sp. JC717]|uniref:hypothetical protein n=1 Tax=Gemmata algarum TaxID=2975278 RepID=UPI0021BB7120|nr:hypothetical protein [Gemmata algarum]MDY3555308.1 hypothetical protein [Gemmata algarum]